MDTRSLLGAAALVTSLLPPFVGCASADAMEAAPEATSSELSQAGGGIIATDASMDTEGKANVGRELTESVAPAFVSSGTVSIPGVLDASYSSPSVYSFAATVKLGAWSNMSTTMSDGGSRLIVRVHGAPTSREGKTAKAIFDAMTKVPTVSENGALVRRSSQASVWCASYTTYYQCSLGPFDRVEPR